MTLDEILQACRKIISGDEFPDPNAMVTMCEAIVDQLGEAHPCGFDEPRIYDEEVWFNEETMLGSKAEARALAASILRMADKLP